MRDRTTKKTWDIPTICLIDSYKAIKGGGVNSSLEVSATGGGIYIINIGGLNQQVGSTSYTKAAAHS